MDISKPLQNFSANVKSVNALVNFDKEVQDFAVYGVQELHDFLKNKQGFDNPDWNGARTLELLNGMKGNPTLTKRYSLIYNQAIVLLVSYFGSAIGSIFRAACGQSIDDDSSPIMEADLKLKVSDILRLRKASEDQIGDLIIKKEGLTFQDMQSIHRAFNDYFRINLSTDQLVHNIITAQACRHAIVHDGATANHRIINQLRNAVPRTLKKDISLEQTISFSVPEVNLVSAEMENYITNMLSKLNDKFNI